MRVLGDRRVVVLTNDVLANGHLLVVFPRPDRVRDGLGVLELAAGPDDEVGLEVALCRLDGNRWMLVVHGASAAFLALRHTHGGHIT